MSRSYVSLAHRIKNHLVGHLIQRGDFLCNLYGTQPSLLQHFLPCPGDLYTPVAIIGGGLAGILCAYMLKEQNIPAVVLEADRIGSGQSWQFHR